MNNKHSALFAYTMFAMMQAGSGEFITKGIPKGSTKRKYAPWAGEHLPKKLRKGKSYEEIQELRKQSWLSRGNKLPEDPATKQ